MWIGSRGSPSFEKKWKRIPLKRKTTGIVQAPQQKFLAHEEYIALSFLAPCKQLNQMGRGPETIFVTVITLGKRGKLTVYDTAQARD
jgi:hypothetical protein